MGLRREVVERAIAEADYQSAKEFYRANEARRGDDVALVDLADGELVWEISWIPRTYEVVGFSIAWTDERWHAAGLTGGGDGQSGPGGYMGVGPQRIPQLVVVLGQASSDGIAMQAATQATTLTELRKLLLV
jgi:hypothetical protein